MQIPLGDPREKQLRAKEPAIRQTLADSQLFRDMDRAARFESCDWQFPIREGTIPIAMLIPEVQRDHGVVFAFARGQGPFGNRRRTL